MQIGFSLIQFGGQRTREWRGKQEAGPWLQRKTQSLQEESAFILRKLRFTHSVFNTWDYYIRFMVQNK